MSWECDTRMGSVHIFFLAFRRTSLPADFRPSSTSFVFKVPCLAAPFRVLYAKRLLKRLKVRTVKDTNDRNVVSIGLSQAVHEVAVLVQSAVASSRIS